MVRKKNLLLTDTRSVQVLSQVYGKDLWRGEKCLPCYCSWRCATKARKQGNPKAFAVSQQLTKMSAPTLYESLVVEEKVFVRDVFTVAGYKPFYKYLHSRTWVDKDGAVITDQELKKYDWRWTGHFSTYIGIEMSEASRLAKRGKMSDQQKAKTIKSDSTKCPF